MGCDGGSIPTRCELVKVKEKQEVKDPSEVNRIRWSYCSLSKEPLSDPIVACRLGSLYNKDQILHALVKKLPSLQDPLFLHITLLKDLIPVSFTRNPLYNPDSNNSPFICPITQLEVGGKHKFVVMTECGCVVSQRALKEIPSNSCLVCEKELNPSHVLVLNEPDLSPGTDNWRAKQSDLISQKQKKSKGKKRKNEESESTTTTTTTSSTIPDTTDTTTTTTTTTTATTTTASQIRKPKKSKHTAEEHPKEKQSNSKEKRLNTKEKQSNNQEKQTRKSNNNKDATNASNPNKGPKVPTFLDPNNVDPTVYSSIFTSSLKGPVFQETFLCRNVARA